MEFFTISHSRPKKSLVLVRRHMKPNYRFELDCNGFKFLVKCGETNIYDEIQMFRDECCLTNILKRYQLGDISVLNKTNGEFIDTLNQPTTLQEALNLNIKLRRGFDNLKPEVKSKFGDFNGFLNSILDGSSSEILNEFNKEENSDGSQHE